MNRLAFIIFCIIFQSMAHSADTIKGMGVGGGGALSGISFDPYNPGHLFIGTDMSLVYESFDLGKTWTPISEKKITFDVDLNHPAHMGFDMRGNLYWASGGCDPKTSTDRGKTWSGMTSLKAMLPASCLGGKTRINDWVFSNYDDKIIVVGTTNGLLLSRDKGVSWTPLFANQESLASLVDSDKTLIHASSDGIFELDLQTSQIKPVLKVPLSSAAMGKDNAGTTLVGVQKMDATSKTMHIRQAGSTDFTTQQLPVGQFVRMSPGNSSVIYFTGNASTGNGENIWLSEDSGKHWEKRYTSDEKAYKDGKINPNPIGLYIGFWDTNYNDFQISPTNPGIVSTSGNFFFKISEDKGAYWKYPYTKLQNPDDPVNRDSFYKSTQLNPISVYFLKRNPANPNMIVAGYADIGCQLSKDNGDSWRMCNVPGLNSVYDVAFNPDNPAQIFAAASSVHDFPQDWHADILNNVPGGIYVSDDEGKNWKLLTPNTADFKSSYLSVAVDFQQTPCTIYAGTQGQGIVASFNCGIDWQRLNKGFEPLESSTNSSQEKGSLIFPSIRISPTTHDVYAIHAGNRLWKDPENPYVKYTGLYKLNKQTMTWEQLGRPPVIKAPGNDGMYWKYPLDFYVDWNNPQNLYLIDMNTPGSWKVAGLWYSSDEGKSWRQILQSDLLHRVFKANNAMYAVGWGDAFAEPGKRGNFLFKSIDNTQFEPMKIEIPISTVDDMLVDEDSYLFGTFGGGIFKVTPDNNP